MPQFLSWLICLLILILDQLTKASITASLLPGQSVPLIKNIFHISLVHNTGIAFGLLKNQAIFFVFIAVIVIVSISLDFIYNAKHYTLTKRIALGLVMGGALGNLVDRLRLNYVIDFLDFRIWPVFNIADSAITVGVFLLAIEIFIRSKRKEE